MYSEMFPSRTRLSGVSISYAMGAITGGAFAPTIAQYLVGATDRVGTVGVYLTIMAIISGIAVLTIREPRGNPLTPQQELEAQGDRASSGPASTDEPSHLSRTIFGSTAHR